MKCEICHAAEATTAVKTIRDGEEYDLYVCGECAKKKRLEGKSTFPAHPAPESATIEFPGGSATVTAFGMDAAPGAAPPEIVKDLLKATLGMIEMQDAKKRPGAPKCKTCKTDFELIKEKGLVGCPDCWETFAEEIRGEFLAGAFARKHGGKPPSPAANRSAERQILRRQLKEAVAAENFRQAAELQRKLRELDALAAKEDGAAQ